MRPAPLDSSSSYAVEVARLLWPDPWAMPHITRQRHRRDPLCRDAYVFPSTKRPRMLVPAEVPGAGVMVRGLGRSRSSFTGRALTVLEGAVRRPGFAGVHWPTLRITRDDAHADSIENHLSECLATEVRVGVFLGNRRVTEKPVLQMFDLQGQRLGFAKIGHNDLTAALVRHEAESLSLINQAGPHSFEAPALVDHARWSGLEVLVMSDLATDPRAMVPPSARIGAMCEVARLCGVREMRLADSNFWARLRSDAAGLAHVQNGDRLGAAVAAVERSHGDVVMAFGGWHGDWSAWNMGMGGGVLKVWDWERFDPEVPIGFDGVHFAAQRIRPGQAEVQLRETELLEALPPALAEFGVPAVLHDLTLRLYLVEIVTRYLTSLTHGATPALARRTAWALTLLERQIAAPHSLLLEGRS